MSAVLKFSQCGFATRAVHAGNDVDQDSGAIKRPITMGNSYALPYDPTDMNWSSAAGNLYIIAWKRYNELEFIQCACRFTENCAV